MHELETLKKLLTASEPVVSESLAADVLRDVEAVLAPRHFNTRVHCTKKSRCRSTLLGIVLGTSLGLLIGVTLTWAWFGSTFSSNGRQIVYVEVPVETIQQDHPEPHDEPRNEQRPARQREYREYDDTLIARAERQNVPLSEIDRLIETTIEQRRQIKLPEGLGGHYTAQYSVSPAAVLPDRNTLLLQRELLNTFQ